MGSDPRKIRQHQELTVVKAISKAIDVKYPPVVDSPLIPKAPDEGEYRRLVSEYIRGSFSSSEGASAENGANCRLVSGIVGVSGAVGGTGIGGGVENCGGPGTSGASEGPMFPEGVSWGNAWEVLVKFLGSEFSDVRRLSASALGTAVQSRGEKLIADLLESEHIEYRYDARYMIAGDVRIRPDFYLPEFDVYIEYFGMNTPEYRDDMLKKRLLYQRAGKKLVSVSYKDADPVSVLRRKLSRYFRI